MGMILFLFTDMCATQVAPVVSNLPASAGDMRDAGSIPGSEESLEEEMGVRGDPHSN